MIARLHIEPGKVVCDGCRNVTLPSVPLEPVDLEPGGHFTCDGCGVRMYSDELDPARPARVVHVSDNAPGAVYVGRANGRKGLKASPLANPYVVGKDGELSEVIEKYRAWTEDMITDAPISFGIELSSLVGKPLACWCRHDGEERTPENACHGDALIQLLQEFGLEDADHGA